ncbi:MAG: biotin/lipoyl-binding protein, partial [Verrucomicrobia bacterium]|nr:biotin/lipoyl-binding protein [Verrucomicrobiota bacterium]
MTAHPSMQEGETGPKRSDSQPKTGRFLLLILFAAGALCFAGIAFYGIRSRAAATERLQQTTQSSEPAVIVVKPEKAPASISIVLPGQTQAYIQASLYAQTTGYVKSWKFDIGSQVREGDVLAEIDTPEVDQQLNQARAQLNNAQSALHLS